MNTSPHLSAAGQTMNPIQGAVHAAGDLREVLCFRIGQEHYGIDIMDVQEIRRFEAPTRMFAAAPDTLGVLDLRGTMVPLLDGRVRLGLAAAIEEDTVTVVFNIAGRHIGLVVDQVTDVLRLSPDEIRPAPELGSAVTAAGITGLATIPSGTLLILVDTPSFLGLAN